MPELPEVETIKNILKNILIGKRIIAIDINRDKTILGSSEEFKNNLVNKTILDISRKGKYLIFHLSENFIILAHLKMEGKFYLLSENEPDSKYAKVIFHLASNEKLCFDDSRCFGVLKLSKEDKYLNEKEMKNVGFEPFEIKNASYLLEHAKNKNIPIKSFLLDQSVMCGLGNIYVDEVLYKSKIHPLTPAKKISEEQFNDVLNNSCSVLKKAIEAGGSTIKSYHPAFGVDGNFQVNLKIYGNKGKKCNICHSNFHFIKVGGRGTTYCPICQMKKVKPFAVGLTGMISSGKSKVLEIFSHLGAKIISSDDIVHHLYTQKDVIEKINNKLNTNFSLPLDMNEYRKLVCNDEKKLKQIERIIHPLVKEKIEQFIKNSEDIVVVEVPLLFEAHFENMFDLNVALIASEDVIRERIEKRNPTSYLQLLKISNLNPNFYKQKADIVIDNSALIEQLEKQIKDIFNMVQSHLD